MLIICHCVDRLCMNVVGQTDQRHMVGLPIRWPVRVGNTGAAETLSAADNVEVENCQ
jgi:hypothetical protein